MQRNALLLALIATVLLTANASAELRVRDLCYVKGQEENTLQGLGLVVGLNGTGDSKMSPTTRALAKMMGLMGNSIGNLEDLAKAKNVALVMVTATIPKAGAPRDQKLDCTVSALLNAKSLQGGTLMSARLLGPGVTDPSRQEVLALAGGLINVDDIAHPTFGRVYRGCRLEADFRNPFVQDNKIVLVVKQNHAGFNVASDIAEQLRTSPDFRDVGGSYDSQLAKATDGGTVVVKVPEAYRNDPVVFVSQVLNQRIFDAEKDPRVVINERSGTIVISGDVQIGAVAVTHNGMTIKTGAFTGIDTRQGESLTKLASLVEALNSIQATPREIIDILKGIERDGQLIGDLIIE